MRWRVEKGGVLGWTLYNIFIDCWVSAPVHGRDILYGLKATDKRFIFHMMVTIQFPGSKLFDTQMKFHIASQNIDVSLAQEF